MEEEMGATAKKMTLGWVVKGETRNAGRQGGLAPRETTETEKCDFLCNPSP
jgi:hypothetical protein